MFVVLTFAKGPGRGDLVPVPQGKRLTIGRSSEAGRKVRDTHLSRVHLEVDFSGERAVVRDLNSRNGVYVNGRRLDGPRVLVDNDQLLAGEQVWDVTYVRDLRDLEWEAEETVSLLDQPNPCVQCGRPISLATFAEGHVLEDRQRYLCPDCGVVVSFDSNVFHGFEILERLGSGSAGLVYKAHQQVLDRVVALKVLRRKDSISRRAEARFLREAATISRLDHPNIVRVFDASSFEGGYYIVMEYFPGRDLQALMEDRGLPTLAVALSIGLQMCDALAAAADEEIVHRDVKPANILYRAEDGLAKLSDFGLAKRLGISAGTRDGETLGTPCYMPPEQVHRARHVDHRADVYALGATLYHLVTDRYPIMADNLTDFLRDLLERDPPPADQVNPAVPPELGAVLRRAMAKAPEERFESARAMRAELEAVRARYGIAPPPRVAD